MPPVRRYLMSLLAVTILAMVAASCGSRPDAASEAAVASNSCLTAGCPCSPGTKVACGMKVQGDDNFIWCYEGTRTCGADGVFGEA